MKKHLGVLALALGLPSTILGLFGVVYHLVKKGYITWTWALVIMVLVVINSLYLMVRYASIKRKN
jgi:hypothetical protein